MSVRAKICGLTDDQAVQCALTEGASFLGFVFFERSPRNISPIDAQRLVEAQGPRRAGIVAVVVNPDDALLDVLAGTLRPDYLQLHGGESPERTAAAARRAGAKAIKAVPVADRSDVLEGLRRFEDCCEHLFFEPRPPPGSALPGGNGVRVDAGLFAGLPTRRPWFLAGGLDPWNLKEAVRLSGAPMVDVSSGVEREPGLKNPALISAFMSAAREA